MAYVRCAPNSRYWPQRVRSVTSHTLNSVRDGIILADLHKSLQIWGWFLPKKIDLPTQGGGRSGNFRGSKNQNSGKCHELSRKSIKFVFFTHPTPGMGKKTAEKSNKRKLTPPHRGLGVLWVKSSNVRHFMNCREN